MICKKCGEFSPDGAAFCTNCGERFEKKEPQGGAFCPICGHSNPDNTAFCRNCGNQLSAAPAAVQQAPSYRPSIPTAGNAAVFSEVKKLCGSLVLVLMFTISAALEIFNGANGSFLSGIMYELGLGEYAGVFGNSYASVIMGKLPLILIVIGMWITYASAKNSYTRSVTTGGLTLIRVVAMINAVVNAIKYFLVLVAACAAANAAHGYYDSLDDVIVFIILGTIIVGTILTAYHVSIFNTAGAVSSAARTGRVAGLPSMYLSVCSFIIGLGKLAGLLGARNALNAITGICSAAAYILLGFYVSGFRSSLKRYFAPISPVSAAVQTQPNQAYPPNPSYVPPFQAYTPSQSQQFRPQPDTKTVKCTTCGADMPADSVFCGKCGAKRIVRKLTCPRCGSLVEEGNAFCNQCGERLVEKQVSENEMH